MLASMYATDHHAADGLSSIIISNSPASMRLWVDAATALRARMPDTDAVLSKCEAEGRTVNDKEYEAATTEFYKRHVCRVWPFPEAMNMAMRRIDEDPTVYHTMNGPNEFYIVGNLREWSVIPELGKITVDTLLVNGEFDEATDSTVRPFFDGIGRVKWRVMAGCSHMGFLEDLEGYLEIVRGFLE